MIGNYKTEIKWALLFIIMTLSWMLLEKLCGLHNKHIGLHLYLTNLFVIPAIWIYVLALKEKKKMFYNGEMSFKQGFFSGLIITLIITLLSPFTQWIISYVITPEYFSTVIAYSVETGYYKTAEEAEAFFNFNNYAIQSTVGALIMGITTSVTVSFFLKSKKHESLH